jgi:hypothetical protein
MLKIFKSKQLQQKFMIISYFFQILSLTILHSYVSYCFWILMHDECNHSGNLQDLWSVMKSTFIRTYITCYKCTHFWTVLVTFNVWIYHCEYINLSKCMWSKKFRLCLCLCDVFLRSCIHAVIFDKSTTSILVYTQQAISWHRTVNNQKSNSAVPNVLFHAI